MRLLKQVSIITLLLAFSPGTPCQQSPHTVRRDSDAMTLITKVLSAAGGVAGANSISDVTGTGKVTFYWADQEVSGSATLKSRAGEQLKLEAVLAGGKPRWTVSRGAGVFVDIADTKHRIPVVDAKSLAMLMVPLTYLTKAIENTDVSIEFLGIVDHAGRQLQEVKIETLGVMAETDPIPGHTKCVFVDPNTQRIFSILDYTWVPENPRIQISHEVVYTDYKVIQGVLIPTSISNFVSEQRTWDLQLDSISLNGGLSESEFEVE